MEAVERLVVGRCVTFKFAEFLGNKSRVANMKQFNQFNQECRMAEDIKLVIEITTSLKILFR